MGVRAKELIEIATSCALTLEGEMTRGVEKPLVESRKDDIKAGYAHNSQQGDDSNELSPYLS
jgi:hypothetical protein